MGDEGEGETDGVGVGGEAGGGVIADRGDEDDALATGGLERASDGVKVAADGDGRAVRASVRQGVGVRGGRFEIVRGGVQAERRELSRRPRAEGVRGVAAGGARRGERALGVRARGVRLVRPETGVRLVVQERVLVDEGSARQPRVRENAEHAQEVQHDARGAVMANHALQPANDRVSRRHRRRRDAMSDARPERDVEFVVVSSDSVDARRENTRQAARRLRVSIRTGIDSKQCSGFATPNASPL